MFEMFAISYKGRVSDELVFKAQQILDEWKNGQVRARKSFKWKDSVINLDRKKRLVILKKNKTAHLFLNHKDYENFIDRKKENIS